MCKHVAAVMYGVGARLDQQPQLLFTLRNVDHADLIGEAVDLAASRKTSSRKVLADDALDDVFGIQIADALPETRPPATKVRVRVSKPAAKRKRAGRKVRKSPGKRAVRDS